MNPLVNLQTGYVPNTPQVQPSMMTWQQGMPQQGLMGNVYTPVGHVPSLMNTTPGDWSKVAYDMAGRPNQGPYATPAALPMPAGVTNGTQSSGGSSIGGTALGILGALAKNPSLLKSAGSAISSLFGGGAAADAAAGTVSGNILMGADAPLASVGTGAVAPAVNSAAADASAALGGTGGSAASGGLFGGAASSVPLAAGAGTTSALGAGAPGVFATGDAAAGSGGAAATGGSLGALGTAAAVAAPFVAQQLGLMLGDAWTGKNSQGSAAMKGWMQASGSNFKPSYSNSGQNTFGTNNGLLNSSSNSGTWYDKSGHVMTPAQVANAIYSWAVANHINPGDFHPV